MDSVVVMMGLMLVVLGGDSVVMCCLVGELVL